MANDFMPGNAMEPGKKQTDVTTDTKMSLGIKVTLTVIVVGAVGAGVYLALTLSQ
ncbi:MAG: hypothetical protein WCT27_04550 [Patescibacteria group bacterium]|jgi:hypothetical protein